MEETLSTLDYAIRAKSIRNKPEINQRMTRNALLKEYVTEIERLKADVLAAREKNGIFFSEETWTQLTAEQELRQTEFEEAKRQVEIVESQLRAVREEFEEGIALLMKRDGELRVAKERLRDTEMELGAKESELKVVREALEDEVVVRQAHQKTEVILDGVASGLKNIVGESLADVSALFDKLGKTVPHAQHIMTYCLSDRKGGVLDSNAKAVLSNGKIISSESKLLATKLEAFINTALNHVQKLLTEARKFRTTETETLSAHSDHIDKQLQGIQDALGIILTQDKLSQEAIAVLKDTVIGTAENVKNGFKAWSEGLVKNCESFCKAVEGSGADGFTAVSEILVGFHFNNFFYR